MTDRPTLFSASMIRALLAARKTQTRRVLKPQPPEGARYSGIHSASYEPATWFFNSPSGPRKLRQRFEEGDRLWVREVWRTELRNDDIKPSALRIGVPIYYEAGGGGEETIPSCAGRLRPGIFLPRWASRLTLTVTDVRVQRLQEISEADAIAEGCAATVGRTWWQGYRDLGYGGPLLHQESSGDTPPSWMIDPRPAGRSVREDRSAVHVYEQLWNHINGAGSWAANPWVVVIQFVPKRLNIDEGE